MLSIAEIRSGIKSMIIRRGLAVTVWDIASAYNSELSQVTAVNQDFDEIQLWVDYLDYWIDMRDEIGNACDAIAEECDDEAKAESLFNDFNLIKRTLLPRTARTKVSEFRN